MGTNYVLLMGLFLLLVAVDCSSSDPKGRVNEKTGFDQYVVSKVDQIKEKGGSKPVSDSIGVKNVKDNAGDQINGSERGIGTTDTSRSNLNQLSDSNKGENLQKEGKESSDEAKRKTDNEKLGDNVHKGQEESNVEAKGKMDGEKVDYSVQWKEGEKKQNPDDSVDPKEVNKETEYTQDSVPSLHRIPRPTREDGSWVEECDSSNMCMDENKRFAACLRVPGNESPDLLLLIQNKGKGSLTIKISAPAFVQLEGTEVELPEKQDKKVYVKNTIKFSIKNSGTENLIVLKDDSGECSLDFKDLIVHDSAKSLSQILFKSE
ncbi:hypothetical protein DITRI_Ditri04bG0139600 [Diplodiscus trichospermus]